MNDNYILRGGKDGFVTGSTNEYEMRYLNTHGSFMNDETVFERIRIWGAVDIIEEEKWRDNSR